MKNVFLLVLSRFHAGFSYRKTVSFLAPSDLSFGVWIIHVFEALQARLFKRFHLVDQQFEASEIILISCFYVLAFTSTQAQYLAVAITLQYLCYSCLLSLTRYLYSAYYYIQQKMAVNYSLLYLNSSLYCFDLNSLSLVTMMTASCYFLLLSTMLTYDSIFIL
jgi:hypothetical protein